MGEVQRTWAPRASPSSGRRCGVPAQDSAASLTGAGGPGYSAPMTALARTPSLILRPFTDADFEAAAAMMGDPALTRFLHWGPRTPEQSREAFAKRRAGGAAVPGADYLALALVDKASGALAGEVSLMQMANADGNGEIGYILAAGFHGRGLGTEAARAMMALGFEAFGLRRITATCDARNAASARIMEKLGMRREAHFVKNAWVKGEWTSALVYAVLAEEWRASID